MKVPAPQLGVQSFWLIEPLPRACRLAQDVQVSFLAIDEPSPHARVI